MKQARYVLMDGFAPVAAFDREALVKMLSDLDEIDTSGAYDFVCNWDEIDLAALFQSRNKRMNGE